MHAYDVIIIGAGPGGIFSAYELMKKRLQADPECINQQEELIKGLEAKRDALICEIGGADVKEYLENSDSERAEGNIVLRKA